MIGVDFDNTIVCYDALFHRVARERGLAPADLPVNKSEVRNHLRRIGREEVWTEMQGDVYGARMAEAAPYPGVMEFFLACRRVGIPTRIISHKTRHPFLGERHDLHQAALQWLEQQGFFDPGKIGLARSEVFLELTKEAKMERIAQCGCTTFIDDLPEVLGEPGFPKIERVLFDPNDLYPVEKRFFRARNWQEARERMGVAAAPEGQDTEVLEFLSERGLGKALAVTPLKGGGNNRVYRVWYAGRNAVLKKYFRHAADPRDRFGSERAFYNYLWSRGIRRTPEPLGWDEERRLGLLSFVDGPKPRAGEVGEPEVGQALEFILELNQSRESAATEVLLPASEACFSGAAHVELIDRRVARLERMDDATAMDREAGEFVRSHLQPAWQEARARLCRDYGDLERALEPRERMLSPSDFGFHNALGGPDGRLRFLDFEYAGWDDPAKLICDFFCQPQTPAPRQSWERFVGGLIDGLKLDGGLARRARLLWPAFEIKWCCIMLNEFGAGDKARRDFAKGAASAEERKAAQLRKARKALQAALATPN
ncbi:MAG: aminoglycoside phosphotransferase family protein [Verrucomicrobiota bacterium]